MMLNTTEQDSKRTKKKGDRQLLSCFERSQRKKGPKIHLFQNAALISGLSINILKANLHSLQFDYLTNRLRYDI